MLRFFAPGRLNPNSDPNPNPNPNPGERDASVGRSSGNSAGDQSSPANRRSAMMAQMKSKKSSLSHSASKGGGGGGTPGRAESTKTSTLESTQGGGGGGVGGKGVRSSLLEESLRAASIKNHPLNTGASFGFGGRRVAPETDYTTMGVRCSDAALLAVWARYQRHLTADARSFSCKRLPTVTTRATRLSKVDRRCFRANVT